MRVTLTGGQVDTFLYSFDATAPLRCGEINFQGQFGYWSEQDGKLRCVYPESDARVKPTWPIPAWDKR